MAPENATDGTGPDLKSGTESGTDTHTDTHTESGKPSTGPAETSAGRNGRKRSRRKRSRRKRSRRKRSRRKRSRRKASYSPALMDRYRLTQDLRSSLRTHEDQVTQTLEELLSPFLEEGERLELETLFRAIGRLIDDRQDRIDRTELAHLQERTADKQHQRAQRRKFKKLRAVMVQFRGGVRAFFGERAVKEFLGLGQPTGREPVLLLRQARRVLERLQDPDRPRPEPKMDGANLDWDRWIAKLERPTRELEEARREQLLEAKETESTLGAMHLDLERYDREVHAAARWLVATYELADLERYGHDLLPRSRRRQRRREAKTDPEAETEKAGPAAEKTGEEAPATPPISAQRTPNKS